MCRDLDPGQSQHYRLTVISIVMTPVMVIGDRADPGALEVAPPPAADQAGWLSGEEGVGSRHWHDGRWRDRHRERIVMEYPNNKQDGRCRDPGQGLTHGRILFDGRTRVRDHT